MSSSCVLPTVQAGSRVQTVERKLPDWDLVLDGNEHTLNCCDYDMSVAALRYHVRKAAMDRWLGLRARTRYGQWLIVQARTIDTTRTYP